MHKTILALTLGATALSGICPIAADAQPASKLKRKQQFDIPGGNLADALQTWGRVSKREIVFKMDDVLNKQTAGVRGDMSPIDALTALLNNTGLRVLIMDGGAVAISPFDREVDNNSATPDILVRGRSSWSLNTGIERTQDDSQPFIVMSRKEIEQSGAPTLEDFLRNQLNVNTSPSVGTQANASGAGRAIGTSAINLRGIGLRDTLILIDGRRQPGINIGSGDISQPSITGIPIASIERIEVLASSASGIYGSGASGGVINIVLRRDYTGGELTTTYSNTTDFAQGGARVDLTAGVPLEGGRTRVSLTANWTKTDPLSYGARDDLRKSSLAKLLANNPNVFLEPYAPPPQGTAVNFKSSNSSLLTLKPAYGGTALTTNYGTIPIGYGGVQTDGIAPLLASLGTYNFEQPNTAYGNGSRAPLIYPVDQYSGSLAVRRTFNDWLVGYAEVSASHSVAISTDSNTTRVFDLSANAPNNPFTQSIRVFLPGDSRYDVVSRSTVDTFRTLGGAIVNLPWDWRAVVEAAYSTSTFKSPDAPSAVTLDAANQLGSGVINGFRDVTTFPLNLPYDNNPYYTRRQPGRAYTLAPSIRLAGPLPFSLPGGKPQITFNAEMNRQEVEPLKSSILTGSSYLTNYVAGGVQTATSFYGEVVFPILGDKHQLPLIRTLELRFSARQESYKADGANSVGCTGPIQPPGYDYFANCPGDRAIPRATDSNSHIDPSISLLWEPLRGITLRGSFTSGYLPPMLSQLVRKPVAMLPVQVNDPLRGGEAIGGADLAPFGVGYVPGFIGGNANLRPETSRTWTAGVIVKPQFVDGLRFSVDWTRIDKKDIYFDPGGLTVPFFGGSQEAFNTFLAAYPERAIRGPASGGYPVGPITALDMSLINLNSLSTSAFDFTFNYDTTLFGGTLSAIGRGTYVDSLLVQPFKGTPAVNYAGVVGQDFAAGAGASGSLRWRGSGSVQWTRDELSLGWQARYMSGYYLNTDRTVVTAQGGARVGSQTYHDLNVTYRFPQKITLRAGLNNVFNTKPPFDSSQSPLYFSAYGDPRLRNFYLGVTKAF